MNVCFRVISSGGLQAWSTLVQIGVQMDGPWVTAERLGEQVLRVGLEFIVDQMAVAVLELDSS